MRIDGSPAGEMGDFGVGCSLLCIGRGFVSFTQVARPSEEVLSFSLSSPFVTGNGLSEGFVQLLERQDGLLPVEHKSGRDSSVTDERGGID